MNKTIIIAIAAVCFSISALANGTEEHPNKYCAKMKDGKKVIMHEGSTITSEVTLKDGTKIKPDGTITKTDGSKMTLKEGQCISMEGDIAKEKEKKESK